MHAGPICGVHFPLPRRAVINDPLELPCMIAWIFRCAPNTRDTKFTAVTFGIVVWTAHFSPGVTAAGLDTPPVVFCVPNSLFNFFLRMSNSSHC